MKNGFGNTVLLAANNSHTVKVGRKACIEDSTLLKDSPFVGQYLALRLSQRSFPALMFFVALVLLKRRSSFF